MAKGKSAAFAWQRAFTTHAERLAKLQRTLLAARANDLRDVGRRVLAIVTGAAPEERQAPPDTHPGGRGTHPLRHRQLDRTRVLGFCTTLGGGATSHVAILARSLDIPAVAGIEPRALELPDGTPVILDGGKGTLRLDPGPGGDRAHRRPRSGWRSGGRRTWPWPTSRRSPGTGTGWKWSPTSAAWPDAEQVRHPGR